jgi:hypothetical protein
MREAANVFIKPTGSDAFEVIDPSVLDLMNAVVRAVPDNAIDILRGAESFTQVERVWTVAKARDGDAIIQAIKDNAGKIAAEIGTRIDRWQQQMSAATEAADEIRTLLADARMVFICAGLGGGTGSGAAPVIAEIARESGALVIAFTTMPFAFEGKRRMAQAQEALARLQEVSDAVICFENDLMGDIVAPKAGIHQAFAVADATISQCVRSIVGLIQRPGLIQIGFDDLLTIHPMTEASDLPPEPRLVSAAPSADAALIIAALARFTRPAPAPSGAVDWKKMALNFYSSHDWTWHLSWSRGNYRVWHMVSSHQQCK